MCVGAIFLGCQKNKLADGSGRPECSLSVEEARDFFEQQAVTTKAAAYLNADSRGFNPGDFTPRWERATQAAANQWVEGVDLPIDPKHIFTAVFTNVTVGGDTIRRTVDVTQKLVVNRWHNHPRWEGMYAYVATIIPRPEYAARHKDLSRSFVNLGDKDGFSGLVVYQTLEGRFVNADRYADGVLVAQVHDVDGTGIDRHEAIHSLLGDDVAIYGGTPAMYDMDLESDEVDVRPGNCTRCGRPYAACICCKVCQSYPCKCAGPGPEQPTPYFCEKCGAKNYTGVCYNCGINPPGGETDPDGGNAPSANGSFSFPGLTKTEARIINEMLNKINNSKLAKALAELLNNRQVRITIVTDATLNALGRFNPATNTITFRTIFTENGPNWTYTERNTQIMVHEMFHAFHHYYEGLDANLKGVAEFQAYLFETIYMRRDGYTNFVAPIDGSDPRYRKYNEDVRTVMDRTGNNPSREDINGIYNGNSDIFKELGGQTGPMPDNPGMDPLYTALGTPL